MLVDNCRRGKTSFIHKMFLVQSKSFSIRTGGLLSFRCTIDAPMWLLRAFTLISQAEINE